MGGPGTRVLGYSVYASTRVLGYPLIYLENRGDENLSPLESRPLRSTWS